MKNRNIFVKVLWAIVFAVAIMAPLNCGCEYVKAGHVGVKVHTLGSEKGEFETLGVGWQWEGVFEDIYIFPTYTQNKVWTADTRDESPVDESFTFQTSEGLSVSADIGMSYSVDATKVTDLFKTYRKDLKQITDTYIRTYVRDAVNQFSVKYNVEQIYGNGKTDLIAKAEKQVREFLAPKGIIVERLYWVSALRLPENVVEEINNKIAAVQVAQRRENEVESAKAQAKINSLNNNSMSAMTIRMKELDNQAKAIEKWNGQLPQTMPPGGTVPFLNMDK